VIRRYEARDHVSVDALYLAVFGMAIFDKEAALQGFHRTAVDTRRLFVAVNKNEEVVAFAGWHVYDAGSDDAFFRSDYDLITYALYATDAEFDTVHRGWLAQHRPFDDDDDDVRAEMKRFEIPEDVRSSLRPPRVGDMVLTYLAVSKAWRCRGVARRLLDVRLEQAYALGARRLVVHVWEESPALHLYERMGFWPLIRVSPWYEDGSSSTIMILPLDDSADEDVPQEFAWRQHLQALQTQYLKDQAGWKGALQRSALPPWLGPMVIFCLVVQESVSAGVVLLAILFVSWVVHYAKGG